MSQIQVLKELFTRLKKSPQLLAIVGLSTAAAVSSCSSGSCSPNGSQNQGPPQYNLSIVSPSEYPAGVAVTIPMLVSNSGYSMLSNLAYSVPSSTNNTGVNITITPGNCTNLPAHSSGCTIYANVPAGSNPGSFVVQATSADSQQSAISQIKNRISSIFTNQVSNLQNVISVTANLGLTDIAPNNLSGADGITLLYPNVVVANPDGTTTIIVTAVVTSSSAGEFNTLTLVDSNGNPISGVTPISGNSGSGYSNLTQGSIVALSVVLPKGSQQQSFYLQTQKNGVNVSKSSSQSQINIVPTDLPTAILSIQPSNFNLNSSYPKQVITLTNNGNGTATGLNLSSLGEVNVITGESTCGSTLAAGASCTYTIGFDSASPVSGTGSITVNYKANSTTTASQTSTIQYTGTDATAGLQITSSSSNFDFSAETNSPIESVVITIKNTGSHTESVTSITPPAPFSINTSGLVNGCGSTPIKLLAGESCSYNLIYNNSSITPPSTVPYPIYYLYKGTGGDKQESSVVTLSYQTVHSKASLSVSSSSINFPTIVNNNYATYTESIVINNQGNNPATNIAINMTNIAPNFFSQTNNCPSSLPAGQSCTVLVKFGPVSGSPATSIESVNISYTLYEGGGSATVSSKVTGQVLQAGSAVPSIDPDAPAKPSGFSGGTGGQDSPYVVQNNSTPPTLTYTIVNDSTTGESAVGMYVSESNISSGWSLAPGNTCGTKNAPISLGAGKSCNLVLQLATATSGNYPLDLSTVTVNWTDGMNPTSEASTSFNGTVNAEVYAAPLITVSPTSANLTAGDSVVVAVKLTGGYNVSDNTITMSLSPASSDVDVTSNPSPCVLNSNITICSFTVGTKIIFSGSKQDYTLSVSNTGNIPLSDNAISISVTPLTPSQSQLLLAPASDYNCSLNVITSQAYCWGYNPNGELGNGTTSNTGTPTLVAVGGNSAIPSGTKLIGVAAGTSQIGQGVTCAISSSGKLYCWGANSNGAVGDGTSGTNRLYPVAVAVGGNSDIPTNAVIKYVSTNNVTSCAVDSLGNGYCWGANYSGQFGNGTTTGSSYPKLITKGGDSAIPANAKLISVATSGQDVCVLDDAGNMYCSGSNSAGQLGNGTTTSSSYPIMVTKGGSSAIPELAKITQISLSKDNSSNEQSVCAVADEEAYCWGYNNGVFGNGTTANSNYPVAVSKGGSSAIPANGKFTVISTANQQACAIVESNAYCWGRNSRGQLGNGSTTSTLYPIAVATGNTGIPDGVSLLNIGTSFDNGISNGYSTCSLGSDDNFYCWGDNSYGELGQGTINTPPYSTLPLKVLF